MDSGEEKYLPVVAYMEYLYHNLKKGNTESMVDVFLEQLNINIVPLKKEDAVEAACGSIGNWNFEDNARSYAIGAITINLNAKLVTNNIKDFQWMENVVTPDEVME